MADDVFRILDANLNRAREALRVLEDAARFAHDDAALAGALKCARHDLQSAAQGLPASELLAARATEHDLGRALKTPNELARATSDDVAAAAFGRLSEALRSLAEHAKLVSPAAAAEFERLRYRGYELEPRLRLRSAVLRRFRTGSGVYALLTEAQCRHNWQRTAEALAGAGVACIQLREKRLADREWLARARWLRALTRAHDVLLALNDRPDLARLAEADVLHLGAADLTPYDARRIVGSRTLLGVSTHDLEELTAAVALSPDYVAVGAMFPSSTKPDVASSGLAYLRAARAQTELPLVAIGGITADNAAEVVGAGADLVCVGSAILAAPDVSVATAKLIDAVRRGRGGPANPPKSARR